MLRLFRVGLGSTVSALVLVLAVTPSGAAERTRSVDADVTPASQHAALHDPFPVPDALREPVAFWRQVFTQWSRSQVALHDTEYLNLIYEVMDLPGAVEEGLTREQRDFVSERREALEQRLRTLADKVRAGAWLDAGERDLRRRIAQVGGTAAIFEAHERVRTQRGMRERFLSGLESSGRYDTLFREIFRDAGLPEDLAYLPHVESSFQNHAQSTAGAVGVWQFTRGAGRRFLTINRAVDERRDPVASARGAARYLGAAYAELGSWPMAITSYNHGIPGMLRAESEYGTDFGRIVRNYQGPAFGFASRNFYAEFLAAREIARKPERYFPGGVHYDRPAPVRRIVLKHSVPAHHLAREQGVALKDLVALNSAWTPAGAQGRVPLPSGLEVWLPTGASRATQVAKTTIGDLKPEASAARPVAVDTSAAFHSVKSNETLSQIALANDISVPALRELNGLGPAENVIHPGQRLRVRAETRARPTRRREVGDRLVHVVRKGESPIVIATSYDVRLADLLSVNKMTRRTVIYPGQTLFVPVSNRTAQ